MRVKYGHKFEGEMSTFSHVFLTWHFSFPPLFKGEEMFLEHNSIFFIKYTRKYNQGEEMGEKEKMGKKKMKKSRDILCHQFDWN